MMNLTLKERERLAYIEGNVELAKVLGQLKDAVDDLDYHEHYSEEYDD
jgi:hypothetical protein